MPATSTTFQPTLPLRGATPSDHVDRDPVVHVSTHAPPAGSDEGAAGRFRVLRVSTHAPSRGATSQKPPEYFASSFLPTLPWRGATIAQPYRVAGSLPFQPTLPLRGATYGTQLGQTSRWFQPTLPLRGATHEVGLVREVLGVSTHAPLAGSDARRAWWSCAARSFNPHSPCGERLKCGTKWQGASVFQPTLPLRGATDRAADARAPWRVSTHAPLAGSDPRR